MLDVQTQSHIGKIIISKLTYKLGGLLLLLPIGFRMEPQLGLYVRLGGMLGLRFPTIGIRAQVRPSGGVDGVPSVRPWFDGRRYEKGGIVAIVEGEAHGALGLRGGLLEYGFLNSTSFETARRNVALVKWSRVRTRLDEVLRRVKALGRLADKSPQAWKVKADVTLWRVKAEAPERMAKGYNRRVDDHLSRLEYFSSRCQNI
ncbi:hypothetical protein Tco_1363177 [Tanacetum coccineum]